ncbi:MAG: hypothetical protein JWN00_359 [Actinomycetia bacterium]|nr:hypothetical protein [Actinomycetes bacterium]
MTRTSSYALGRALIQSWGNGPWDPHDEQRHYPIVGLIDSGDRIENRVLLIDGRGGLWDRIRTAYENGNLDSELAEVLFIEDVIEEDIGETSGSWAFPGPSYTVTHDPRRTDGRAVSS